MTFPDRTEKEKEPVHKGKVEQWKHVLKWQHKVLVLLLNRTSNILQISLDLIAMSSIQA